MSNIAAEFSLLAGLCQTPEVYFDIAEFLSTTDFTQKAYQRFFIVLQRLLMDSDHKTDMVVTEAELMAKASELGMRDFYTICDNGELIRACISHSGSKADTVQSFQQVKKETVRTTLAKEAKDLLKYLDETPDTIDKIIAHAEDRLIAANSRLQGVTENPVVQLPERALAIIEDLANHPGELGLDIGLPTWQRGIGGIRNGSITFVAATTKAGKSQLAIRAAIEVSKLGIPVLLCDSELNEVTQGVRALGQFMEIPYDIWETGYWKADPEKILADGYDQSFVKQCDLARKNFEDKNARASFLKLPLFYHSINAASARESIPFLRRWVMQHVGVDRESRVPRCLVIWDYIKLADIAEVRAAGVGAHEILAADCSALHNFAEKYNLPMIAFGQTNRELDDSLACIAGAKKITELCDSVSIFKEKSDAEREADPTGSHLMRELATRYGKGIRTHVNLETDLSIGKFIDRGVSVPRTVNNDDDGDDETINV